MNLAHNSTVFNIRPAFACLSKAVFRQPFGASIPSMVARVSELDRF